MLPQPLSTYTGYICQCWSGGKQHDATTKDSRHAVRVNKAELSLGGRRRGLKCDSLIQEVALSRAALCEVIPFARGHGDKHILALWS